MLTEIYARSMMHATRHVDVPQRPLAADYARPARQPGRLRQIARYLRTGILRRLKLGEDAGGVFPVAPRPSPCK